MSRPVITSVQNQRVKDAVRLRDRRGREKAGRIIIDGGREIGLALDAGVELLELFIREEPTPAARALAAEAAARGAAVWPVTDAVAEKLAFGDRSDEPVAVARPPACDLAALDARLARATQPLLVAVLEGVEKPGNVGAVLRTADAAGVSAVIVADGGTDLFNPNAIRASLGALFTLPVASVTSAAALAWLRDRKLALLAARVDAEQDYTAASFRGPAAILLGSEAAGLSATWSAADITPLRLPLLGQVDSLNVSVTAAVLFYEALRQRRAT